MSGDINSAISIYYSRGSSSFPQKNRQGVIDQFGIDRGNELLLKITNISKMLDEMQPNWSAEDLEAFIKRSLDVIKSKYPDIEAEGLSTLDWVLAYGWK